MYVWNCILQPRLLTGGGSRAKDKRYLDWGRNHEPPPPAICCQRLAPMFILPLTDISTRPAWSKAHSVPAPALDRYHTEPSKTNPALTTPGHLNRDPSTFITPRFSTQSLHSSHETSFVAPGNLNADLSSLGYPVRLTGRENTVTNIDFSLRAMWTQITSDHFNTDAFNLYSTRQSQQGMLQLSSHKAISTEMSLTVITPGHPNTHKTILTAYTSTTVLLHSIITGQLSKIQLSFKR